MTIPSCLDFPNRPAQFFLTKRSLYLLVLDARQGEDERRVEYWLAPTNSFVPDAPVLIMAELVAAIRAKRPHMDL